MQQFANDYAKIMRGYDCAPCQNGEQLNPNVYYEEFSIFDKSLQYTSVNSLM